MTNEILTEEWMISDIFEMKEMIDKGFDIDLKDADGDTALLREAYIGDFDKVKLLLNSGADIYIEDCDGKDAYITAKEEGYMDIAEIIEKYADVS